MIIKDDKNELRKKRHLRVRSKVSGTAKCPRLNVYRSLTHIYAQVIDDEKGVTLVSASTMDKDIAKLSKNKSKSEQATIVGAEVGKRALKAGIKTVVFDRGGYLYAGRIKNVAEGARSSGLVL